MERKGFVFAAIRCLNFPAFFDTDQKRKLVGPETQKYLSLPTCMIWQMLPSLEKMLVRSICSCRKLQNYNNKHNCIINKSDLGKWLEKMIFLYFTKVMIGKTLYLIIMKKVNLKYNNFGTNIFLISSLHDKIHQ